MSAIFYTIFYEPLLNGLVWLVGILPYHDIGFAVIILTLIVRVMIFPFTHRSVVNQTKMKQLEPKMKEIKEKYKKDSQEQAKKIMDLYKEHGINPFSGFITLLIQIPVIFALYKVFAAGISFDASHLYSFISAPEYINVKFLGIFDMTQKSYVLAMMTGITPFFQLKMAIPPVKKSDNSSNKSFKDDLMRSMSLQMKYVMPILIIFIALRFSSAVSLYWTTMNIFAIVHEASVRRKAEKILQLQENGRPKENHKNIIGGNSG